MELSYSRLRTVYRLEKASQALARVEPDFYDLLRKYLQEESRAVREAWKKQDLQKLIEFANLQRLVSDLVALRQRKVVNAAVSAMFLNLPEPENLVGWEKDLYRDIISVLEQYRRRVEELIGLAASEPEVEAEEEKPEHDLNVVRVRILRNIPAFVGTDLKKYGPYQPGDVVELPTDVAKILELRGFAEVISDA